MIPAAILCPDKVAELLALAEATQNQDALKQASEALVAEGAFGVPWIVAERADGRKHSFFGSDRLEVRAAG
jgi:2-hydroxychromene-2-carboxylate isomerase